MKTTIEMGYYVDMGVDKHGAQVQLDKFEPNREVFWELGGSIRADTLPLAICRAALAAVQQEVNDDHKRR
jgi:hypothetical protein